MQRKPSPRALAAAFLLVSATVSIVLLGVRNLYDDEVTSAALVMGSVRRILQFTATGNVHPPGMYLLAHLAYLIVPSIRWINIFPALFLYAGLAVYLLQVTPLFDRTPSKLCLLLLATLHPQLLLWGVTFRWYGWWTGLALIALTITLQPRKIAPTFGLTRALFLGLLLAGLFYLNYITLLFAFALGAAMLLRYRAVPRARLLVSALFAFSVFIALAAPQFPTMLNVHLPNSASQRSGLAASFLRLLQSIAASEAFLPWHPLAILACIVFILLSIAGLIDLSRLRRGHVTLQTTPETNNALASVVLFGIVFFFLIVAFRLGGKPRNGLLLIPVLAPIAAWIIGALRHRLQTATLLFLTLWSAVGIAHMASRYALSKASMTDRPELVAAFIRQTSASGCSVVVTYDPALAFSLVQSHLPRLLIIAPFKQETFAGSSLLPGDDCVNTTLYAVKTYLGEDPAWQQSLNGELQAAAHYIQGSPRTHFFSVDPDAARKRQLARLPLLGRELGPAALLPDYRYVVTSGPMDRGSIDSMRMHMPDFDSGAAAR
jgi:hypothetical protein